MYQFTSPMAALAQGQLTPPVNNFLTVAMQQLIRDAQSARQA